jgi:hypothetical protein
MSTTTRFLTAALLWAAGLAVLMVAADAMASEPQTAGRVFRWVASALGLAMFPAGVTIAPALPGESRRWRLLLQIFAAAFAVSAVVLALSLIAVNVTGTRSLADLLAEIGNRAESWETRNDAAWTFVTALLAGPRALLFAAIGVQVGIWAEYAMPRGLRRPLYWIVGIGLMVSAAAIGDTTYEVIVLHTGADASFAALYTLLLPLSVCAGLGLPTLAVFRDPVRFRS